MPEGTGAGAAAPPALRELFVELNDLKRVRSAGREGTIAERVEQYLPKLLEVVPSGPYILAGWSLGGALAYGCAQKLQEAGHQVAWQPGSLVGTRYSQTGSPLFRSCSESFWRTWC